MAIEKDTTFKYIGKNFIKVLFDLVNMPETVDPYQLREETEEMISLKISQLKPDFVGRSGNVIVMFEFESSYVGKPSKKRFHAYVALYARLNKFQFLLFQIQISLGYIPRIVDYGYRIHNKSNLKQVKRL